MPDAEIEIERVYTVPLSRAWIAPRHRRVVRAVNMLREFAERHMKSSEIKIDSVLNETLWNRGVTKPPRRITVKMSKDEDGLVTISLPKTAEEEEEAEAKAEETVLVPEDIPKVPPKEEKEESKPVQSQAPTETEAKRSPQKTKAKKKKPSKTSSGDKKKKTAKKSKSSQR